MRPGGGFHGVAFGVACDEALAGVIVSGRPDPKLSRRIVTLREEVASGLVWAQGLGVFGRMGTLEQPEGVIAVSARRVSENPVLFPARYHQARASGFLRAHARSIRAASQLSRDLRRYAVNGLLADPPHTSNVAFARGCRCDPSRLEYRFRELPGVTPKEFCQAVLAVHVGMRRPFGCSWEWSGWSPPPWETNGGYLDAMYFEVFNNNDAVLFLDGIVFGSTIYAGDTVGGHCEQSQGIRGSPGGVLATQMIAFPGSGAEFPIGPGETRLVAVSAIDHSFVHPDLFDLSHADFEIGSAAGVDNPAVPDMVDVGLQPFVLSLGGVPIRP